MNKMDLDAAKALLERASELSQAQIIEGSTQRPFEMQSITLDLTTARSVNDPFKIGFPYASLFVRSTTDSTVSVSFKPGSRDEFQSAVSIKQNDSMHFDRQMSEGYLYWTAQSGKSITIVFFVTARFQSGSQLVINAGGISIADGDTMSLNSVNLSAATAAAIAPALSTRRVATLQNQTGADLWVGDSTVTNSGATQGIKIADGATFYWRNLAALYGYSVAGGRVNRLEEA